MSNVLLTDASIFARRNLEHIRQVPEKLTNVTIQPLMFVLLFAYVFGGAIKVDGAGYKEYLIGGILIQTLAFAMMGPAMSIATDLKDGVIDRFRSLPSRRSAYLLGHYLAEMVGSLLTIAILLGTGFIVGWRTHASAIHVTEAMALLLVFASAMIWLGLWLGILVRSPDAVMGIGFVLIFPVTFISNAFVPIVSLPSVLQWVASAGLVSRVRVSTASTSASVTVRGAPGRGSSSNPSRRWVRKRVRHLPTVWWVTPSPCATAVFGLPLAHSNTIRARWAKACALFGRRAQRSSASRSSFAKLTGAIGLPVRIGVFPPIRKTPTDYKLFNVLMTQDTRS